jgi:hypothetical protein
MYGMIHRAAREMVLEAHGPLVWADILARAGLADGHFISASTYEDYVTTALLAAIASVLGVSGPALLTDFGRYWIGYVSKGPYGAILRLAGDDLATALDNLDRMHDAIRVALPDASPPSFRVLKRSEAEIRLAYRSARTGLEPFVAGLLQGLMAARGLTPQLVSWTPATLGADFTLTAPRGARF